MTFVLRCAYNVATKVLQGQLDLHAHPGQVFCYFPKGDGTSPGFETHWEPEPDYRPEPPAPFHLDSERFSSIKAKNQRPDTIWEVEVSYLPTPLTDRERPYLPRFVLIAHQKSCFLIHYDIAPPETPPHQLLGDALLKAIEKSERQPSEVHVRDEAMVDGLAPISRALGIQIKAGKLKVVRRAKRELERSLRTNRLSEAGTPEAGRPSSPDHRTPKSPAETRITARPLLDLARAIREQEFESDEELDEWLDKVALNPDLKKAPPEIALEVAQSVMYEAWETEDSDRRIELAERALSISPNCADAYNLLAKEDAETTAEALDLYRKGVEAGEKALGSKFFKENAGHFWGMLETRPYMRARLELARCLWESKRHDEALGHYYEMLRLNPSDNQGIRYILLACLGELGRFEEMDEFMGSNYQNDYSAEWFYTKALLAFVREGASTGASAALRAAMKQNKHAPDYLTGKKSIPRQLPDRVTLGGEDEAYCYASDFLDAWKRAPGALDWLEAEVKKAAPPKAGRNEPCPCGSGRKFKKCCGAKENAP